MPSRRAGRSTVPTRSPRRAISSGVVTTMSFGSGRSVSTRRIATAAWRLLATGLPSRMRAKEDDFERMTVPHDTIRHDRDALARCHLRISISWATSSGLYWKGETPNRPRASINSLRDTPAISDALPCEMRFISYHLTAAAQRRSHTNVAGSSRSDANAPSGLSMVIWIIANCPGVRPHDPSGGPNSRP